MIAYRCTLEELRADIEASAPGWLDRAAKRSEEIAAKGKYEESKSIWSEVKAVYMRRQGGEKCAFCERKLESQEFGMGEQAVEHFRPKGRVTNWKMAEIPTTPVAKNLRGYYKLAYHPFNYSAACIPCNSSLKGDKFPIAGVYNTNGDDPRELREELPLLLYPIGDFDADPENLIAFHGVVPHPVKKDGVDYRRGYVTIAFFHLEDGAGRGNLFKERANVICSLHCALNLLDSSLSATDRKRCERLIGNWTRPTSAHTNCARSFVRLYETDPGKAAKIADLASELAASSS
ncbi:MAG: hypothetical protein FJW30_16125 [Acidobacteria bacterium]|nr:hypothetical protein [Acidobacteriota bacterium]